MAQAATRVVLEQFPKYKQVAQLIQVRIAGLPMREELRHLRQLHLNHFIRVNGVVTTTTGRLLMV